GLTIEPPKPVAGRPTRLTYEIADAATGLPVKDLEPYLGAWAHTVVLREDVSDFAHSHAPIAPGVSLDRLAGGPALSIGVVFARPGRHRVWTQFQRRGVVVTVPFDVSVSRLERLARWDGQRWSPFGDPAPELDGAARALAVLGTDLYLGGDFTRVAGVP